MKIDRLVKDLIIFSLLSVLAWGWFVLSEFIGGLFGFLKGESTVIGLVIIVVILLYFFNFVLDKAYEARYEK